MTRTRCTVNWTPSAPKTSAKPRSVNRASLTGAASGERLDERHGEREGRRRVLAGVEVAVDDDVRVPGAAALLERSAGRTEPVLKQPAGLAGEADLLLLGVAEAGHPAPVEQPLAVLVDRGQQRGRAVADRRDRLAERGEAAPQATEAGRGGQVFHRAVAARHEHQVIIRRIGVLQRDRVAEVAADRVQVGPVPLAGLL